MPQGLGADLLAADDYRAAARLQQAGGQFQNSRLAAAGRADEREELALGNLEARFLQGRNCSFSAAKGYSRLRQLYRHRMSVSRF